MKLDIPLPVQTILRRFYSAGFEASVVGGCVRDSLLGLTPKDWDITTSARPEQVQHVLGDFRLLATGLKHGTVTALSDGMPVEITTYRIDGTYSDNRRPDSVCFTNRLADDLSRRDFTINAMAYSEQNGLTDCFGGQEDLQNSILRCVGEPDRRFEEDALRILRGLRFCAVLGLTPESATAQSMQTHCRLLDHIAKERIGSEFIRLLCGNYAPQVLREYPLIVGQILPEILPMIGFEQHNPHHIYDVWEHTLHALDVIPADPVLRLAILLHDSGKPYTYTQDKKGVGHFHGHGSVSVELAQQALTRLRFDGKTTRRVCSLIRIHDMPLQPDPAWIRRRLSRMGEEDFRALLEIRRADSLAQNPAYRDRLTQLDALLPILEQILAEQQCFSLKDLCIDGTDLITLGLRPGPMVGELLKQLLDAVIQGKTANEKEALLTLAKQILNEKHR
ncbi:CCA tRNA nucleotidyltransferase [Clostridium merdae]|uniref:CCA tRNA nucleotidyltransferase n=1 Tax=Clostridium merdae TaxID=1958780 RepID=UPI000A26C08C|nr:HD domain-containing protein [Clostridium merdae]